MNEIRHKTMFQDARQDSSKTDCTAKTMCRDRCNPEKTNYLKRDVADFRQRQ